MKPWMAEVSARLQYEGRLVVVDDSTVEVRPMDALRDVGLVEAPAPIEHSPWTYGMPRHERRKAAAIARRRK